MTIAGGGQAGALWYDLRAKQDQLSADLRRAEGELRSAGRVGEQAFATPMERALGRVGVRVRDVTGEMVRMGKGPDELARSFLRAADSADEAFQAVRRIGRGDTLDTAKARRYAETLDDISVEAQQVLADLRDLTAANPRFDTPEMRRAATELDRVGREAAEGAAQLRQLKGVGASTEFERMAHEAREASNSLDDTARSTDGLMTKLNGVKGVLAGLGLYLGTQELLRWAGDAFQAFTLVERSGRTVDQVFGKAAGTIRAWGEEAADAAGLSKREVQESAAVLGSSLVNMGIDADRSANIVVRAQRRAADLALAYGKDVGDAINGISALMRGEYDTIEKFGVRIKQADVNARVLASGMDTSTQAAKRQAEALATLDLFFEQTAGSAGRFADANDDTAARLERSGAKWENFIADVIGPVINSELDKTATDVENFARDVENILGFLVDGSTEKISQLAERWGVTWHEAEAFALDRWRRMGGDYNDLLDSLLAQTTGAGQELGNEAERAGHNVASGFENAGIDEAISEPVRRGKEAALRELNELYAGIAGVIAERENQLRQAGGEAVQAWLDPQLWASQLESVNAEIVAADQVLAEQLRANAEEQRRAREEGDADALAEAQRTGDELVREHERRTLELTAEAIQLQMNLASTGTAMEQAANLSALRTSEFMRAGLASKDPEIRALFEAWDAALAEAGVRMESEAISAAGAATQGLLNGLERRTPEVHRSIFDLMNVRPDTSWARGTGAQVPIGIAGGISEEAWRVQSAMLGLSQVMRAVMPFSEPKDPRSGLRGITRAFNIVPMLAAALRRDFPAAQAVARDLSHILTPDMSGLAVPSLSATDIVRSMPTLGQQAAASDPLVGAMRTERGSAAPTELHQHAHLHVSGRPDVVDTEADLARLFGRVVGVGFGPVSHDG